ncbi:MAG TPA: pyridoxamine 5'-phosphate oxidase family protein [Vicinamibacteria bacterium]
MSRFHEGEIEVQERQGVRADADRVGRIVARQIPETLRPLLARQRLAVAATLDARSRPWASLLTGPEGFIEAADEQLLRLDVRPRPDDPLVANLKVRQELGLLVLDPRTRQRLRVNGRGLLSSDGLFLLVDEVYGNCPKYIQKRRIIEPAEPGQEDPGGESVPGSGGHGRVRRSSALDPRQRGWIEAADTLFLATWHPRGGADASHRGGRPGFVRVIDERTLEFPDYPGNNLFNSLGNLAGHPHAGLLFVEFETGNLLQITARARVVWEPDTVVRLEVDEVIETPQGSGLRFQLVEPSPVNP